MGDSMHMGQRKQACGLNTLKFSSQQTTATRFITQVQVGTEAVVTAADEHSQASWCKAGGVKVFKMVRPTQSIRWGQ